MTAKDRNDVLDWLTQMHMHPEDWDVMYSASEIELLAGNALEMLKEQEDDGHEHLA